MIWQFNEIWPTGGWGSIEYGAPNIPGQVLGGRWKPLHYMLMNSVYTDVTGSCCQRCVVAENCYVKNDGVFPFIGRVEVHAVEFATGATVLAANVSLALAAGAGVTQWFSAGAFPCNTTHAMTLEIFEHLDLVASADVSPVVSTAAHTATDAAESVSAAADAAATSGLVVRCAFSDRILHLRMPLDPTHVCFKRTMRVTNGIPLGSPLLLPFPS
jgi:hypothetical protein